MLKLTGSTPGLFDLIEGFVLMMIFEAKSKCPSRGSIIGIKVVLSHTNIAIDDTAVTTNLYHYSYITYFSFHCPVKCQFGLSALLPELYL